MAERDADALSEEEASRLWERAAQLQAEAAGRVDAPEVDDDAMHSSGYELTHVRSAALEAGIADEFVEVALAELRAERTLSKVEKGHPLARRFLNQPPNTISVRRILEATPQEVLSAMKAVFPEEPFRLTLTDQQGDPHNRGVLVFDIPGMRNPFQRGFALEVREVGLRQLFVSLHPMEGSTSSCEIAVHSPITSHNIAFGLGMFGTTLAGGAGFAALGALGLTLGIGPVAAVGGVLLGAGLGAKGFRAMYGFAVRRARRALDGLVGTVAARAKGVWLDQLGP
jgi:hypothetical protein